jgi:hypothetical protein
MKGQTTKRLFRLPMALVVVAMLVMLFGTCCSCQPAVTPTPTPWVRRLATVVWAGQPATNPPLLNHDNAQALSSDDGVTTDDSGEAELHLGGCSATLYVFKDGDVVLEGCRKNDPADVCATNASVLVEATCAAEYSFDVDTRGCKVIVKSTALSLTYLPNNELSLIIALDGTVSVRPVVNLAEDTLGKEIPVDQGFFLHTMPGPESPDIAGLPAREPVPISELPRLVQELQQIDGRVEPWMYDLTRRAGELKLLPPGWPFEPEMPPPDVVPGSPVELIPAGGALEDPRVQEALFLAIDTRTVAEEAFEGQSVDLRARVAGEDLDAYEIPFDRERAKELLAEAGWGDGFGVKIPFPAEDDQLAKAAEWMASYLFEVGIEAIPVPLPVSEIMTFEGIAVSEGKPILSLRRL